MSEKGLESVEILDPITRQHVERAAAALEDEFSGVFGPETIARYIAESTDLLGGGSVNVFVPVLAHRFARERLRRWRRPTGCSRRRCRRSCSCACTTPVAARWRPASSSFARQGRIHVRSAGSDPGEQINPAVIEAMAELGVDMSEEFPKPLTDEVVRAADVVITMGCGDACPIYPGKKYEDWKLDDPAGQDVKTVRRIRDELDTRVQALVDDLLHADN